MTTLGVRSALLSQVPGVSHAFFGRTGGTSPAPWRGLNVTVSVGDAPARVAENLARVRFQLGVGRRALFTVSQVHGRDVVEVQADDDAEEVAHRQADALITRAPELAVGVRTADCAPILLARRDGAAVAAAHAGWRGAVGGVIQAAVAALGGDLVGAVGPTIGPRAFEVGPEVIDAAAKACSLEGLVERGEGDRSHLDLAGLCLRLLQEAGVEAERVGGCTVESLDERGEPLYFSHRRDAGRTGRQMSAIALTEPPELDEEMFR